MDWFGIIVTGVGLLASLLYLQEWVRNHMTDRNVKFPSKLKRGILLTVGLFYLGWMLLAILGWGIITVNAAQQPGFFTSTAFPNHIVVTFVYFMTVIVIPGAFLGQLVKRWDPEHWPGNKKTQESEEPLKPRKVSRLPYIQIFRRFLS
ncbi:MAG TPA: hypothetical protein VEL71_09310 [Candidatus Dormibacteraeota bacterium]|nr:hypothetical protein [Candidatus Dormibacteraeota bacterium]